MTKHNQSAKAMKPVIVQPINVQLNGITQEIVRVEVYLSAMFTEKQIAIIKDNLNNGLTASLVQVFRIETMRGFAHDAS